MPSYGQPSLGALASQMPGTSTSPLYTNESLKRKPTIPAPDEPISLWDRDDPNWAGRSNAMPLPPDPVENRPAGDILAESQDFLANLPPVPGPLDNQGGNGVEYMQAQGPSALRGLTELIAAPAGPLAALGTGAALTGVGAPAAAPLFLGSSLMAAPDIARRLISPDPDESRMGAGVEAALMGLMGGSAGRAMGAFDDAAAAAARGAQVGPPKFGLGREVPYQSAQPAVDINRTAGVAKDIMAETGQTAHQALRGYRQASGGTPHANAVEALIQAGKQARTGVSNRIAARAKSWDDAIENMLGNIAKAPEQQALQRQFNEAATLHDMAKYHPDMAAHRFPFIK